MRYATAAAFRTAFEQRLLATARGASILTVRLRKLVAFKRLLVAAPDRWVPKGALAFHFRLAARFRITKDPDLGRWDDERAATDDLFAAQRVDLGDYFRFDSVRTAKLDHLLGGAAVRYHVSSYLAGRWFEELTVDVGFGDSLTVAPERLRGPDLPGFAEIAPVEIPTPTLPLEQHVAKQVHASTRTYAGGHASTRTKDLIDLILIASLFPFQAGRLRRAPRHVRRVWHPSAADCAAATRLGPRVPQAGGRGWAGARGVDRASARRGPPRSAHRRFGGRRRTVGAQPADVVVLSGRRHPAEPLVRLLWVGRHPGGGDAAATPSGRPAPPRAVSPRYPRSAGRARSPSRTPARSTPAPSAARAREATAP